MSSVTFPAIQPALRLLPAVVFVGAGTAHFVPGVQRTMAAMVPPRLGWSGFISPR